MFRAKLVHADEWASFQNAFEELFMAFKGDKRLALLIENGADAGGDNLDTLLIPCHQAELVERLSPGGWEDCPYSPGRRLSFTVIAAPTIAVRYLCHFSLLGVFVGGGGLLEWEGCCMRLVIFGAGGLGREVLRLARECYSEVVFADDDPSEPVMGAAVIHPGEVTAEDELLVAIGRSDARRDILDRFPQVRPGTVVAKTAIIGENVQIGEGSVLCDFTMVTASAKIGRNFQCNIYSYVAHDCVIGDDVTFGPRVCCNGNVQVGDGAHVSSGANIRNGRTDRPLRIGEGAFVCMGAVVTEDVPAGARVRGNPARVTQPN